MHTLTSSLQRVSGIQELAHNVCPIMYSAPCFFHCVSMLRHWEMGGQSKSIKSLDSGQGLGDPSPQGHPNNHQIFLFRKWHVYKHFKNHVNFLAGLKHRPLCLIHNSWFIAVFFSVNGLTFHSVLPVSFLDRMQHFSLILSQAECFFLFFFIIFKGWGFFLSQQWDKKTAHKA